MLIGYARTSTADQEAGLEAQVRDLRAAGVGAAWHAERASAVGERPILEKILAGLRPGDTLVVTKLDRLARNVAHLGRIVEAIREKGAELRILNLNLDTGTPTGILILNMLGAVAQFEREMMLERQREGIEKAKKDGKYTGRKGVDPDNVRKLVEEHERHGETRAVAIELTAAFYKIGQRQVYRIVNGGK